MVQIRPQARTTPGVRAEIACSTERASVMAKRYGISDETVRKWRRRGEQAAQDRSSRSTRLAWRINEEERAIIRAVNRRAKLTPYRRPILTPPFGSLAVIPVVDRRGPRTTTRTVRCAGGGVRGRSLLTHRVNRRGWGSGGRGFRLSSGF